MGSRINTARDSVWWLVDLTPDLFQLQDPIQKKQSIAAVEYSGANGVTCDIEERIS